MEAEKLKKIIDVLAEVGFEIFGIEADHFVDKDFNKIILNGEYTLRITPIRAKGTADVSGKN